MKFFCAWMVCLVIFGSAAIPAQLGDDRDSMAPGREITQATNLIYEYQQSHNGSVPKNWSEIWNAADAAWAYRFLDGRPMVHRVVAFIDEALQTTADKSGAKIIAITRLPLARPFGEIKDGRREWIDHRLVVLMTKDGKIKMESVKANQPYRGIDLDKLVLKEPDLTDNQLADTASEMFRMGFNADQIYTALGSDAVEVVKKSGKLDPVFKKDLDAPLVPTPAPTTAEASASVVPNSTPAAKAGSSGFPIWQAVILGAVIVAGAVFLMQRRSG